MHILSNVIIIILLSLPSICFAQIYKITEDNLTYNVKLHNTKETLIRKHDFDVPCRSKVNLKFVADIDGKLALKVVNISNGLFIKNFSFIINKTKNQLDKSIILDAGQYSLRVYQLEADLKGKYSGIIDIHKEKVLDSDNKNKKYENSTIETKKEPFEDNKTKNEDKKYKNSNDDNKNNNNNNNNHSQNREGVWDKIKEVTDLTVNLITVLGINNRICSMLLFIIIAVLFILLR